MGKDFEEIVFEQLYFDRHPFGWRFFFRFVVAPLCFGFKMLVVWLRHSFVLFVVFCVFVPSMYLDFCVF